MDDATRQAIERRAYALWEAAGRPDGSALGYWLQAELDLGIIKAIAPDDPFVTLQELAEEAREQDAADTPEAAEVLQRSVDAPVPRMGLRLEGWRSDLAKSGGRLEAPSLRRAVG